MTFHIYINSVQDLALLVTGALVPLLSGIVAAINSVRSYRQSVRNAERLMQIHECIDEHRQAVEPALSKDPK